MEQSDESIAETEAIIKEVKDNWSNLNNGTEYVIFELATMFKCERKRCEVWMDKYNELWRETYAARD